MPKLTLGELAITVKNGFESIERRFDQNDEDHREIKDAQRVTNGNVSELQKWKCRVEGAWTLARGQWAVALALAGLAASIWFK